MTKNQDYEYLTAAGKAAEERSEQELRKVVPVAEGGDGVIPKELLEKSPETITIVYDYPLHKPVRKQFTCKYGFFTVEEFKEAVWQGYKEIYDGEPAPSNEQRRQSSLLNRPSVEGSSIWGHDLEDLVLEGWEETEPGVFELYIGS